MEHFTLTYEHYLKSSNNLLEKIKKNAKQYKAVICPLRGGFFLSYYISKHLNIPMQYLQISSYNGHTQNSFNIGIKPNLGEDCYLLCDDIYDSGHTIKEIISMYPKSKIDTCVLISKQDVDWINYDIKVEKDCWVDFFWEIM